MTIEIFLLLSLLLGARLVSGHQKLFSSSAFDIFGRKDAFAAAVPYNLGLTAVPPPPPTQDRISPRLLRALRYAAFVFFSRNTVVSVAEDSWEIIRKPGRFHDAPSTVAARKLRAEALRKLIGAGYTPRLVFLVGLMLRGFFSCTAVPVVFDPPIGFGAGSAAAAGWAGREWLPVCMAGWYLSGPYWKVFGVNGPPSDGRFEGVPISVRNVLNIRGK